ncbi:HupE/UreJ family protein [Plastorhodobacter daqingensis]|uniref:HupE/UreJ family protein n=1 Tax=Plastorhodobacter daqingensis TaxID=1387281 RepID=A0ABW2UP34_9RHOB
MKRLILSTLPILAAAPALAHPGHVGQAPFVAGVVHPLLGADHLLAMIAVGLWAAHLGGAALPGLPAAFVAAMVAGFTVALGGGVLPLVEPMILASVLVLGLMLALALRLPTGASAALVALFGLFHGFAHGQEMGEGGAAAFGAGFALSTALLHAAGAGLGLVLGQWFPQARGQALLRALGAVTLTGGVVIAMA